MSLASQVSGLATRIATEIKSAIRPRLMPPGGTAGQVLTKTGATDYATGWATPASGGLTAAQAKAIARKSAIIFG